MAADNEKSPRPAKRRKVAESCKVCRAKKTRCDGQRPVCAPCRTKGATCEYNDATIPVPASTLSDFEARLRRLEGQGSTGRPQYADTPIENPPYPPLGHTVPRASSVDSAAAVAQITDHPTTRYIRDMTQIADNQAPMHVHTDNFEAWPVETDKSCMVVPPRAIADNLLDCYERYYYPLFPILHMPTLWERYEQVWGSQGHTQPEDLAAEATFHATLNIVFALGCLNDPVYEPQLKLPTANTFYRRARALLPLDALDFPTLEVVQCLLLVTSYLSFTRYSNRCCNTLAVATRVAQTLGLHMNADSSSSNQLKREMSRRVWHHCLTLERLFASLFGRQPVLIADHDVPLPSPVDDEYLSPNGAGIQPPGTPSMLDAFITTIDVFEILEGAHKINYGSFKHGFHVSELTEVLQLIEKIDQIEKSLPAHLIWHNGKVPQSSRESVLKLQAEAVMTRILHIRLVLLRPNVLAAARRSLLSSCPSPSPSRTETALRNEVSSLCIEAAVSAIHMLHSNLRSASRIFSSNAVFVTLSAATVIVAASLVPDLDVSLEEDATASSSYKNVIAKALEVLDEHRWQVEGAPAAKDLLEKFLATVNLAKRNIGGGVRQASNNPTQIGSEQQSAAAEDTIVDFDFSDPLWDFQWGGSFPLMNMPGPVL